jgi:hypothetical protein
MTVNSHYEPSAQQGSVKNYGHGNGRKVSGHGKGTLSNLREVLQIKNKMRNSITAKIRVNMKIVMA